MLALWEPSQEAHVAGTWLLLTGAEEKCGDRVLGEGEIIALLLCQAKKDHSRLMPQRLCHPKERWGGGFIV